MDSDIALDARDRDCAVDRVGNVPLLAPARRVLAVLAALEAVETPVPVIAAHADLSSACAHRHLQHLARLRLVQAGKAQPETFRIGPGPSPATPAELTAAGHARAGTWLLGCIFEAARTLGAEALPSGERVAPDPLRPPHLPTGRPVALTWFAAEREQLARELDRASERGEDALAWRMAVLLLNISCFSGPWTGWRRVFECGMAAARREAHRGAEAMLLEFAGKLELTGGDVAAARRSHRRSLNLRLHEGDAAGVTRSLNALGVSFLRTDALAQAEAFFTQVLELAERIGDAEFHAYARMNLGAVDARSGRTQSAVGQLREAIRLLRTAGREVYIANAFEDIAVAYRLAGDLRRAEQAALAAEVAATTAGVPLFLPGPLIEHAHIQAGYGDLVAAKALLCEACGIYRELGDGLRVARVQLGIDRLQREMTTSSIP